MPAAQSQSVDRFTRAQLERMVVVLDRNGDGWIETGEVHTTPAILAQARFLKSVRVGGRQFRADNINMIPRGMAEETQRLEEELR